MHLQTVGWSCAGHTGVKCLPGVEVPGLGRELGSMKDVNLLSLISSLSLLF